MVASGTVCRTSASASRQEHAAHWYDLKPIQVGSSNKIFDSIARSRNAFPLVEDQGPQMSLTTADGRHPKTDAYRNNAGPGTAVDAELAWFF
jgi:hypothetical protein